MIKLITDKRHRFGKSVLIKDTNFQVDNDGTIEVPEGLVTSALEVGFVLVDKDAKFTSDEEAKKIKDVDDIISSARMQAKEIISEAHQEAKKIIMEAQTQSNAIIINSGVEEKDEFLKKLQERKVDNLREVVASSDLYTQEQIATMKKADLINAIMEIRYPVQ